jgi:predicted DNA-binding transcriptional regulator AlpA
VSATDVEQLLTGEQVAERLGISRQRVQQLAGRSDFPPPAGRVGKATVFNAGDVDAYASGIRAFVVVNGISIPHHQAAELAARLGRRAGLDTTHPGAETAARLETLLESGGSLTVTDDHAVEVFGALQEWLEQTNYKILGPRLQDLRYRLFGELQDAGVFT